ncbi:hypothetical protein [Microbacterium sp. CPCC 204701]|nr:hypothetical protein [Microbacterium sp. CPCC 204701]
MSFQFAVAFTAHPTAAACTGSSVWPYLVTSRLMPVSWWAVSPRAIPLMP